MWIKIKIKLSGLCELVFGSRRYGCTLENLSIKYFYMMGCIEFYHKKEKTFNC